MLCFPRPGDEHAENSSRPVIGRRRERKGISVSFENLNIDPRCLRTLKAQGITDPSPVQAQAIPVALEGHDLVAIAQTGTGKTLGFGLPSLTRLVEAKRGKNRMLVLAPTRELAVQVHAVLNEMGRTMKMTTACVYGGVGMEPQTKALRRGVDIVVATPGRLLDHIERGNARFNDLSILVLDEADRMLDMGFLPDIKRIVSKLPKERQTLMFSATFPKEIERMASTLQHNPVRVEVGAIAKPADAVSQAVYTVQQDAKMRLLTKLLRNPEVESALVFLRTKHRTDRVAKTLHRDGFKVQAIHGGRSQGQRQQAIDGFRKGRFRVLVATDVAARGIDVDGITHVVNFDIPNSSDDYIHRIGRTARASATGDAITFVSPQDSVALGSIEKALGRNLPQEEWEGAVPVLSLYKPQGSGGRGRGGSRRRSGRRLSRRR